MKRILLACGSGASSGFIAQSMRKAAKEKGLEIGVKAVSDTEILDYAEEIDLLLIGPHLRHRFAEIEASVKPYKVKALIIDQTDYATLNGGNVLETALKEL